MRRHLAINKFHDNDVKKSLLTLRSHYVRHVLTSCDLCLLDSISPPILLSVLSLSSRFFNHRSLSLSFPASLMMTDEEVAEIFRRLKLTRRRLIRHLSSVYYPLCYIRIAGYKLIEYYEQHKQTNSLEFPLSLNHKNNNKQFAHSKNYHVKKKKLKKKKIKCHTYSSYLIRERTINFMYFKNMNLQEYSLLV